MAYGAHGGFPAEYASKVGHMRLIQDPLVQKVVAAFESTDASDEADPAVPVSHTPLDHPLSQIVTVDGGSVPVPNLLRVEKQVGFIQIAAQLFRLLRRRS
jgi:hypothetical protein